MVNSVTAVVVVVVCSRRSSCCCGYHEASHTRRHQALVCRHLYYRSSLTIVTDSNEDDGVRWDRI